MNDFGEGSDEQMRRLLGDLPEDEMPADVAARLDNFIAGIPQPSLAAVPDARQPTRQPAAQSDHRRARPSARRPWLLPALGGIAAGLAAIAIVPTLMKGSTDSTAESSAAGDERTAEAATNSSAAPVFMSTNTAYSRDRLDSQVRTLVTTRPAPTARPRPDLAGCVEALRSGVEMTVVVADSGTYDGFPALLIALRAASEPRWLDVWVVEPGCSPSDAQVITFRRLEEAVS